MKPYHSKIAATLILWLAFLLPNLGWVAAIEHSPAEPCHQVAAPKLLSNADLVVNHQHGDALEGCAKHCLASLLLPAANKLELQASTEHGWSYLQWLQARSLTPDTPPPKHLS